MVKKKKDDASGLWIPACLFIGMGLGFIFGNFVGFLFLGLGSGFILTFIFRKKKKK